MSNKETLQTYNNKLIQNNKDLQTVINMINNLPEAGEGGDISDDIILYKELEYLETEETYGQYLVTNHKITNKTRIRAKFSRDLSIAGGSLFGVFTDAGPTSMFGYQSKNTHRNRIECYWGEPTQTLLIGDSSQLINTTDFVVDVNRNNWAVYDFNGQALGSVTFSNSEFETEHTTPILAARVRTDIVNQYGYAKLYYCQIYEDDVLIYDLVPAIDSDERVCMYNKVDGTFLYNAGTGAFIPGPVVAVVKENINAELDDYNTKLTTQETTLEDIVKALQGKASGGGSTEPVVEPDYITDGLISWWEGEDGFDENAKWYSRVGTDYISPTAYGFGDASTNPPVTIDKAVYNNGIWGYVTHQEYCIKDYTIQVVGRLDGSVSISGNSMNMLVGMNMSASPMIGVNGNGNAMFMNGSNVTHSQVYPNMTRKIFNASLNLVAPPTRGVSSTTEVAGSVNGEPWFSVTNKTEGHNSKGLDMTILCYYTASYRSCGARLYSLRVYNRKLTEEELQYNYEIDKARFGIEELEG